MGIKTPSPPSLPMPPPTAHPSTLGSQAIAQAGLLQQQRAKQAQGKGFNNTIATSPEGAAPPQTAKTYLG